MKSIFAFILCVTFFCSSLPASQDWNKHDVNWKLGPSKIKSISYPKAKEPRLSKKDKPLKSSSHKEKISPRRYSQAKSSASVSSASVSVWASVIDSPPVNGFVPWIAVTATDARGEDGDFLALPEPWVTGNFLSPDPDHGFAMGLFDTGASAHVIGYQSSLNINLNSNYISPSETTISGVTGSVQASVSKPLAIFVAGLSAVGSDGIINTTKLKGQSNVCVAVGQNNSPLPDLATAIGSPMSVFYTTVFENASPVTVIRENNEYTAPKITVFDQDDPCIPAYSNSIPLELRPLGSTSVQYIPSMEFDENFEFYPQSPSIITGTSSQSLFFVASVDLHNGSYSAIDKTRFMLDTGAQITVVGSRVASRLNLKPAQPDFEVEIEGVSGETIMAPGFYIDQLDIPALGDWMSFTNIPVIMLDIPSPEGGTLDGIIGMNLFANTNFVLRGGGFMLEPDPVLEYEMISTAPLYGDIAPAGGDSSVDFQDLAALASCWLSSPGDTQWNAACDIWPQPSGDSIINFADFAALASGWFQGASY